MKKILVIDDEAELLEAFGKFLDSELTDVAFLSADNGNTGLEIAERERPNLIILDMKLGAGPHGLEVLRRLKLIMPETPVIVWAGYNDPQMEAETQRLGVYTFIEKPTDVRVLLRIIREAMEKS